MNCKWNQNIPLNIFAFRPHAHSLGKRIIGMKTDGKTRESKIIADGDPQKPQAFYPLKDVVTIKPGDSLFARCTYDSTAKARSTQIGKPYFHWMYILDLDIAILVRGKFTI